MPALAVENAKVEGSSMCRAEFDHCATILALERKRRSISIGGWAWISVTWRARARAMWCEMREREREKKACGYSVLFVCSLLGEQLDAPGILLVW